jgi:hypothetical protein
VIIAVRIYVYLKIIGVSEDLVGSSSLVKDNHFGMFMGNAFENKGVSILVTFFLMVFIVSCFSLSMTTIRYFSEVEQIMAMRRQNIVASRKASINNGGAVVIEMTENAGLGSGTMKEPLLNS